MGVLAALMVVEMNLLCWFALGGLFLALLVQYPEHRLGLILCGLLLVSLFMATTYPGLYKALGNRGTHSGEMGGMTIGWSNPVLLGALALWAVPGVRRAQPVGAAVGAAVAWFTMVVLVLQKVQLADGQPYPYSYHYFAMVDPLMAIGSVWAVTAAIQASTSRWLQFLLRLCLGGLLISQLYLFLQGQAHIWKAAAG